MKRYFRFPEPLVEALASSIMDDWFVVRLVGVTTALVMFVIDTPVDDMLMFPFTPLGKKPPEVTLAWDP